MLLKQFPAPAQSFGLRLFIPSWKQPLSILVAEYCREGKARKETHRSRKSFHKIENMMLWRLFARIRVPSPLVRKPKNPSTAITLFAASAVQGTNSAQRYRIQMNRGENVVLLNYRISSYRSPVYRSSRRVKSLKSNRKPTRHRSQ